MSTSRVIIYSKNTLYIRGLIHFAQMAFPDVDVDVIQDFTKVAYKKEQPDKLIIIDFNLLPKPFEITLQKLYSKYPESCFLALSEKNIPENVQVYFNASLSPTQPGPEILDCLKTLCRNELESFENQNSSNILSDREIEVLQGVALGLTNMDISERLHISVHTAITHRKNISSKLGIKTIAGLTVYALLNGIISANDVERGD